jgi:hypothetical protein
MTNIVLLCIVFGAGCVTGIIFMTAVFGVVICIAEEEEQP